MKIKSDKYYYAINKTRTNEKVLKDLDINIIDFEPIHVESELYKIEGNNLYINTWIGCYLGMYKKEIICDLKNLHDMFIIIYEKLNINIESIEYYIPMIDFNKVEKNHIDKFVFNTKKKILISNGNVRSNQASNINLKPLILELSKYKDYIFILTDDSDRLLVDNIFYTNDIIKSDDCDLLEISYLSTKCDIIIGRSSGPYTYCMVKENFYNVDKLFIGISYNERESIWFSDVLCKQYFIKDDRNINEWINKIQILL
jgi:hypothetical protein